MVIKVVKLIIFVRNLFVAYWTETLNNNSFTTQVYAPKILAPGSSQKTVDLRVT